MPHDSDRHRDSAQSPLERLEWHDIREAGCYLHVATGLVARVYLEDLAAGQGGPRSAGGGTVVRLDGNPGTPMPHLRHIAERHGLKCLA